MRSRSPVRVGNAYGFFTVRQALVGAIEDIQFRKTEEEPATCHRVGLFHTREGGFESRTRRWPCPGLEGTVSGFHEPWCSTFVLCLAEVMCHRIRIRVTSRCQHFANALMDPPTLGMHDSCIERLADQRVHKARVRSRPEILPAIAPALPLERRGNLLLIGRCHRCP